MRKHVVEACHAALRRLQVEYLDLFYCHRPDIHTPIEETVRTMHTLIQQGKVLYWGTSEWTAQQITEAHYWAERYGLIGPVVEQPQYNMLERTKVELDYLPVYKTFGLGTTIWSPLASGLLTGKYLNGIPADSRLAQSNMSWLKDRTLSDTARLEKIKQLDALAKELGVSLTHLSLRWCLHNPNVSSVILGASKVSQLEDNLRCYDAMPKVTDEVMTRIDTILGNKPVQIDY